MNLRKSFYNVLRITKNDAKAVFSNPIVVIVIIGIIILPSLYALLNIMACWNFYDNTDNLVVAIANSDEGASYEGVDINVGDDVVKDLKNNSDFDWKFVSESELREGVKNGTYYSGIVIPKNFSESIVSITTDNPHSAELQFVINEKSSPVASRLSAAGASAVYKTINAKVVTFINLAALGKLDELQEGLSSGASQLSSGAVQIQSGASQVSSGASEVSSGASQVSSGASEVSSGSSKLSSSASKVQSGASEISSTASKVSSGASSIDSASSSLSSSADQISGGANQVSSSASQLSSSVNVSQIPSSQLQNVVNSSLKLANSTSSLAQGSSQLAQGSSKLASSSSALASGSVQLADGSVRLANGSVRLANGSIVLANGATSLANGSTELANGALSLAAGSELLANSSAYALLTAASSLADASGSLENVTGVDEDKVGDYIYSPVILDRQEVYPVSHYGSEVAPFFIVLSLWIGGVITCVMLKPGYSSETEYSPTELYFGKLTLFVLISLLQAGVTLTGCFILGIDMHNPLLFVFSILLASAVFMLIIYSIIAALGNVGKAIAVIILVFQVSGTGGIYPIQLMDWGFQVLYPFLPMTYAITMMRESLLGLYLPNYLHALGCLLLMGLIVLVLAIIIKTKMDARAHYFEDRMKESGLF